MWSWVNWTSLHGFAKSTTFLKRQRSIVSICNVSRDFFRSRWASSPINLVCLLSWPFYTPAARVIRNWPQSSKIEVKEWLSKSWWSVTPLGPTFCVQSYLDRANQPPSWQFFGGTFWYQDNLQVANLKILLANPPQRHWGLSQGLWRMFGIKSGLTQTLWWSTVIIGIYIPMKGPIYRFCDWYTYLNWLEKRQLWLHFSHYWWAHKDGALQVGKNHYQCLGPNGSYNRCGSLTPWPTGFNCNQ